MNSDIIKILLSEEEIKYILSKSMCSINISQYNPLRYRKPITQLDSLFRGYLGEYAFFKYMLEKDITFSKINYKKDGEKIDMDLCYKGLNVEIKTSMIPDIDDCMYKTINTRDIKLIRRENSSIEDLQGDIHIHILFNTKRHEHDEWILSKDFNISNHDVNSLYKFLNAEMYRDCINFVGWVDKKTLVQHINKLPEEDRCWSFRNSKHSIFENSKRYFWNFKIKDSHKPSLIIPYLKSL